MSLLDNLNDVGWFVLCAILYAAAFVFTLVLCKGAAIADSEEVEKA